MSQNGLCYIRRDSGWPAPKRPNLTLCSDCDGILTKCRAAIVNHWRTYLKWWRK
jgi:hypothetical protein